MAVAAARLGWRVGLVDLDPQATASKWGKRRQQERHTPEIDVVASQAELLGDTLAHAAANGADLVFVDTAPSADRASLVAARQANFMLIPVRPATFDIEAIGATRDVAELARKPAAIVINAAIVRTNIALEARRGLEAAGAALAPMTIHQRIALSHAVIDGRTAMELEPGGKAALEVEALTLWTCGQVGLQACRHAGKAAA
jgi:chromosome partitioning protein